MNPLFCALVPLSLSFVSAEAISQEVETQETPRDNYVLSARGPKEGEYTLGMGGSLLYILPSVDVRWLHGLVGPLQADVQLKTIGIINVFDAAMRFRLVEGEYFSLALRAGGQLTAIMSPFGGVDVKPEVWTSGGGGALFSIGPSWMQWTLSGGAFVGYNSESKQRVTLADARLGVEFPVAQTRNMFIEARAELLFDQGGKLESALPILSMGVAW